ncbi:hypothetical protein N665_0992s0004 [Sinapis alba]|nr:hypothetical protein N665_0992s0004 [Sinapis alba]
MENHVCAKKFPRPYNEPTSIDKSGYIVYGRRKNETAYVLKDGILFDNDFVKYFKKYVAHINVEWCNKTSAVKYFFKYITKRVDKTTILTEKGTDPQTSEKGEQNITIKDTYNLDQVICKPVIEKTIFTDWMVLCSISEFARTLKYVQILELFTWNNGTKVWSERKRGTSIGRVVTVHPASGDRYNLRILINRVKGPRSFTELNMFGGVRYPDYKYTCCARGLLANDAEWHEGMTEINTWGTPSQLRKIFITFLIYCHVANPKDLWNKWWKSLSEDILYKKQKAFKHKNLELDDAQLEQYTLIEVEKVLRNQEHTLSDFPGLPTPDPRLLKDLGSSLWNQELEYNVAEEKSRHDTQYNLLNTEQLVVYDAIIESIHNDYGNLFFRLRRRRIILLVAFSGIASLLLLGGRTAHSRFNIPVDLTATSEKADLIIWDEAPIAHKHTFEAIDKSLKDILYVNDPKAKTLPFGGKTVLLGGDFRQILPVIPQGTRADIVSVSISHSYLWESCKKFTLQKNMRLNGAEKEFSKWVLNIGDGNPSNSGGTEFDEDEKDQLIIVDEMLVEEISSDPHKQILETTYGQLDQRKKPKKAI